MTEAFLQHIWKFRLFDIQGLQTTNGEPVEIVHAGEQNMHAGPDFLQAKIKIGNTIWAGHVEIHIASSMWNEHKHSEDKAYNNVVLHVVLTHDKEIKKEDGVVIPTIELANRFDSGKFALYEKWLANTTAIPCANQLASVSEFTISNWLERMTIERLEAKTALVSRIFEDTNHNWEETCYRLMARNMGFQVNADAFEALAAATPQLLLAKHKSDSKQIEAMLFGQAGLLDEEPADGYQAELKKEYEFLKHKYTIHSIPASMWKYSKMRPYNFPTSRIALLAALVYKESGLFAKFMSCNIKTDVARLLDVQASAYWNSHFRFGKESKQRASKRFSSASFGNIIINTIAPLIFFYGSYHRNEEDKERAVAMLHDTEPESNAITSIWEELKLSNQSAARSQAFIHLYNQYCVPKKCLSCGIGHKILAEGVKK